MSLTIIQCFVVWTLFAFSQDEYDYTVYEREYDAVQRGFGSDYEIGYVWLNDICAALGLTYVEFRAVVGLIFSCGIGNYREETDSTSECGVEFVHYFFRLCLMHAFCVIH